MKLPCVCVCVWSSLAACGVKTVTGFLTYRWTTAFCTSPGTCWCWDNGGPQGYRWWCTAAGLPVSLPSATCGFQRPCRWSRAPWPRSPAGPESVCAGVCWPSGETDEPVWEPCACTCSPLTCRRTPSCRSWVWTCTPSLAHCCRPATCPRGLCSNGPAEAVPILSGTSVSVSGFWKPNQNNGRK